RPYDTQVHFPIGHHATRQDVVLPIRRYDAVEALLDQIDLVAPVSRAGHATELHQTPRWPHPTTPTGHEQHTVGLLPLQTNRGRDGARKGRVCPREAIAEVHHVKLEAVRLQVVPETESVVQLIIVVLKPETLRFELVNHCRHDVDVPKVPKDGNAWVVIANI